MAITGSVDLGDGGVCVTVDHDPTSVSTDLPKGSLIVDANGNMYRKVDDGDTTNVNDVGMCKCNHVATVAPTVNEDSGDGYSVGSHWYDVTADKAYVCLDATGAAAVWLLVTATIETVNFIIDGAGAVIAAGIKGDFIIDFAGAIVSATLLADQSGSIVVDIWKDVYANFPPDNADSITAAAPPTISAATKSQDTTLTGWTKAFAKGDCFRLNVDSCATITRCTLSLQVLRS